MEALLEEEKIADTVRRIRKAAFSVLDFIEVFRSAYPGEWRRLSARFGRFGEKRRYTVTT